MNTPITAAAMTKDEAVRVLAAMREDLRILSQPTEGRNYDCGNENAKLDADALDLAIAALTAPAGVPDGVVVAGWQMREVRAPSGKLLPAAEIGQWRHADVRDVENIQALAPDACRFELRQVFAAPPSDVPGEGIAGFAEYAAELRRTSPEACAALGAQLRAQSPNPSPAEQGAREARGLRPSTRADAIHAGIIASLRGDCNPNGSDYDRRICAALDRAVELLNTPPLAAGRVGVAEVIKSTPRHWFTPYGMEASSVGNWIQRDEVLARIDSLASPLVAGEVEARGFDETGLPGARPLVYADTAKGADHG